MEVGSQATPFEHRSFGEELELCKRYFELINGGILVGTTTDTTSVQGDLRYSVSKRAGATIALKNTVYANEMVRHK